MSLHTLQSDTWRLWCDPNRGSQWTAAEVKREGQWHSVVPDCRPKVKNGAGQRQSAPLAAANFHMIPYSNRIRDGKFSFQGMTIQLDGAQAHAIHGAVRKLPWKVISGDSSQLITEFQSKDHASVNWPWPFISTIEQHLEANLLTSRLTLSNEGDTAMPAGMGWHPYFVRTVNGFGEPVSLPAELDFSSARELDPKQPIEPVTNANDAFNLSKQSIQSGTTILEPGETLTATMTVRADMS